MSLLEYDTTSNLKPMFKNYEFFKPKNEKLVAYDMSFTSPAKVFLKTERCYKILSEGTIKARVLNRVTVYRSIKILDLIDFIELQVLINPDYNPQQIKSQIDLI